MSAPVLPTQYNAQEPATQAHVVYNRALKDALICYRW